MADTLQKAMSALDQILSQTKLDDVSAESQGYSELPNGYYLCEVDKTNFGESKTSHLPMVSFTFKIVEDGTGFVYTENEVSPFTIKSTKNRLIFKHYVFKDESSVKRFASDMLKFEGDTPGESLLPKEAFITSETMLDALDILVGYRIFIQADTNEKEDGTKATWYNLISWKRAAELELIS